MNCLPTHIHGLELDIRHEHPYAPGQFSAWPATVCEYGVVLFPDGKWMVTLPEGCAVEESFESALVKARIQQHEELWRGWARMPYGANPSWTGPEGDAWIADGGTLD